MGIEIGPQRSLERGSVTSDRGGLTQLKPRSIQERGTAATRARLPMGQTLPG